MESQADYRASAETLTRKLVEAGSDIWQLLEWLRQPERAEWAAGPQAQLLKRVFAEQFDLVAGGSTPLPKEKEVLSVEAAPAESAAVVACAGSQGQAPNSEVQAQARAVADNQPELEMAVLESATAVRTEDKTALPPDGEVVRVKAAPAEPAAAVVDPAVAGGQPPSPTAEAEAGAVLDAQSELGRALLESTAQVRPKGKGELSSDRLQNPHDPDATYAVKGQGRQKKEHVGYKVQVAESVSEAVLASGEPTRNFLLGIVTHRAYESDEAGALKMEQEQGQMGFEKPSVQYVDGAYVSAQKLVEAQAEGREIIGPAQPAPRKEGRFSVEDFQINVEERTAVCPVGKTNTQCSRLVEEETGKVSFRFEFSTQCHGCTAQSKCLGKNQPHRTVVVGEHHSALQARRQEQQTEPFKERMKHRNGIEGTQSELVRGHGLRRARYRGLPKVRLQNYFIGAACNVKRWLRRQAWEMRQAMAAAAAPEATAG